MTRILIAASVGAAFVATAAHAVPISVLWWDATPTWGNQAPDTRREAMADYLTSYDGGGFFDATYVSASGSGQLATHLASNSYDVIVLDDTSSGIQYDGSDVDALKTHYAAGKDELMLDGSLYIRNIAYSAETDFPGPNGAMGGMLVNQIAALGQNGGGIMMGNDHDCCQDSLNYVLEELLPGAGFSGLTNPSTDGSFNGSLLLNHEVGVAAIDIFNHWSAVPSQGIAATGDFTDYLGASRTLFSLVEVADKPGGGPRYTYISSTVNPGSGQTDVDDDTIGGDAGGDDVGGAVVPLPGGLALLLTGLAGLALGARGRRA